MRDNFARFHASEIKHGRMAVIAAWGFIVPELVCFASPTTGRRSTPKAVKFEDVVICRPPVRLSPISPRARPATSWTR